MLQNVEIPILRAIRLNPKTGHLDAIDNKILVVKAQTVSLLGRDTMSKLGQQQGRNNNNTQSDIPFELQIIKKFSELCTTLGSSKNHIA